MMMDPEKDPLIPAVLYLYIFAIPSAFICLFVGLRIASTGSIFFKIGSFPLTPDHTLSPPFFVSLIGFSSVPSFLFTIKFV